MARKIASRDISPILDAAMHWITTCLIQDGSVFSSDPRWTQALVEELHRAFVEQPDYGQDDFMTKLQGQMRGASPEAVQLMGEMLWALLLFPSNMKARTKRQQIRTVWAMSGQQLTDQHRLLTDDVLTGIGSGGPGFNNYRPNELEFLIELVGKLKQTNEADRREILRDYETFITWIDTVPRQGSRQFRHMLRYFAFPDQVERISSNNDRRKILDAFAVASSRELARWKDRQLDEALLQLRTGLQREHPTSILDFYEPPLRQRWAADRVIRTLQGEVTVTLPSAEDERESEEASAEPQPGDARQSIQIQAKLARIGAIMGFKVWIPRGDRARVRELLSERDRAALLEHLPLNYDDMTLGTIELIDVLWLKGIQARSIARAFEVEHTTAVYSGLLRMADLLALQPNMNIRLHIVAPDERREKVFREMQRPVFSLLDRGPLAGNCTFLSYESVNAINEVEHLAHTTDSIIAEYEESPAAAE